MTPKQVERLEKTLGRVAREQGLASHTSKSLLQPLQPASGS